MKALVQRRRRSMVAVSAPGGSRRLWPVIGLVAGAGLLWGAAVGLPWVVAHVGAGGGTFRVAAIEVHGLRLLSGEQILQASGVEVGTSLFDVDLDDVAAHLDSLVWVASVRVERKPPDRLVVHLEERRRALWVERGARLHGLDAAGVLLPPDRLPTEGITDLDLPVLKLPTGLPDSLAIGDTVADRQARRLVGWWATARHLSPDLASEISELGPLDEESLRLRLVADDLEVRLPYGRVGERLAALRQVLDRVYGECPNPAYLDLRFAGQAVVGRRVQPPMSPAADEAGAVAVGGQVGRG